MVSVILYQDLISGRIICLIDVQGACLKVKWLSLKLLYATRKAINGFITSDEVFHPHFLDLVELIYFTITPLASSSFSNLVIITFI